MSKQTFISLLVLVSLRLISPVYAEDTTLAENRACNVIQTNIKDGNDIRHLVRTSIQMGFEACFIIGCAVEANGDLEQIVGGAIEGGAATDVIARCAMNEGVDHDMLANIIISAEPFSLCYLPPRDEMIPMGTTFPGGRDDRRISPSSF